MKLRTLHAWLLILATATITNGCQPQPPPPLRASGDGQERADSSTEMAHDQGAATGRKAMKRVVTGYNEEGKSVFINKGGPPHGVTFDDGTRIDYLWTTHGFPAVIGAQEDPAKAMTTAVPDPDGTNFITVRFPGNSQGEMHATDSVDCIAVLSGEVWLQLDSGEEMLLTAGDTVVQNGTLHAWRNPQSEPCVIAAVLIGAARRSGSLSPDSAPAHNRQGTEK